MKTPQTITQNPSPYYRFVEFSPPLLHLILFGVICTLLAPWLRAMNLALWQDLRLVRVPEGLSLHAILTETFNVANWAALAIIHASVHTRLLPAFDRQPDRTIYFRWFCTLFFVIAALGCCSVFLWQQLEGYHLSLANSPPNPDQRRDAVYNMWIRVAYQSLSLGLLTAVAGWLALQWPRRSVICTVAVGILIQIVIEHCGGFAIRSWIAIVPPAWNWPRRLYSIGVLLRISTMCTFAALFAFLSLSKLRRRAIQMANEKPASET